MLETFESHAPSPDQFLEITKKIREVFGGYDHLTTSEPVLEIIEPGVAWVVQGQHGSTLVSKNMLILDVDHTGNFEDLQQESDTSILDMFENDLIDVAMPTDSFRVYRTFKGYRLIYTKAVDTAEFTAKLQRFGNAVGIDFRYGLASRIRKASQARLKPKSPQMRREFLDQDAGHGPRRACRYVGTVNDKGWIPCSSIAAQIRFHDEQTEALSDFELDIPKELF